MLALDRFGDQSMRPALEHMLETEKDRTIILTAVEALSKMGDEKILPHVYVLMRDSTSGFERKALVRSLSHLIEAPDRLYRMLQADPMARDRQVAGVFSSIKRRLDCWDLNQILDAPYYETLLTDGLSSYEDQKYNETVNRLYAVGGRVERRLAASSTGADLIRAYLAEKGEGEPHGNYTQLLRTDNRILGLSSSTLEMMHKEGLSRPLHLEEFLLCVVAFRQIVTEVLRMSR